MRSCAKTGQKKRFSYLVGNLVATNWPIEKALNCNWLQPNSKLNSPISWGRFFWPVLYAVYAHFVHPTPILFPLKTLIARSSLTYPIIGLYTFRVSPTFLVFSGLYSLKWPRNVVPLGGGGGGGAGFLGQVTEAPHFRVTLENITQKRPT